jgi:hypothetical protein
MSRRAAAQYRQHRSTASIDPHRRSTEDASTATARDQRVSRINMPSGHAREGRHGFHETRLPFIPTSPVRARQRLPFWMTQPVDRAAAFVA